MSYQFENLVFEGGGVKGIAYGGALELLEAKGIMPQIKQTSGASAGAIAALLVGLGCSSADVTKILSAMDFKNSSIITAAFSARSRTPIACLINTASRPAIISINGRAILSSNIPATRILPSSSSKR